MDIPLWVWSVAIYAAGGLIMTVWFMYKINDSDLYYESYKPSFDGLERIASVAGIKPGYMTRVLLFGFALWWPFLLVIAPLMWWKAKKKR